jgi:tetratricopeptide (TPR) repeat protein
MDTMPWNYYTEDKQPKPATREVVTALEAVLAREPKHAGAIHLYIHAVEASPAPGRAEAPADRLADLVPGAGHLVHMPSHIYFRVGRYQDANEANDRAAKSDESYISQCLAQGFYPALYYPHNVHFQWSAATYEGRSEEALKTAKKLVDFIPPERAKEFPFLQEMLPLHLFTLARFGRWQEILDAPAIDPSFVYASAMASYARGMALAGLDRVDEAEKERAIVAKTAKSPDMKTFALVSIGSTGADLLGIAALVLEGEIATSREDWKIAIRAYDAAVAKQDALTYSEPPPWYFPIRDALGRAYLGAGRPADAETAYRKQLELTPRNGWSLYGLAESLKAQNKKEHAAEVARQFDKAWERADVEITASVF